VVGREGTSTGVLEGRVRTDFPANLGEDSKTVLRKHFEVNSIPAPFHPLLHTTKTSCVGQFVEHQIQSSPFAENLSKRFGSATGSHCTSAVPESRAGRKMKKKHMKKSRLVNQECVLIHIKHHYR